MAKKNVNSNLVAALIVLVAVFGDGLIVKAGNLEPSAAPGSTMKTLDEVEPRVPIEGSVGPKPVYIISASGSYYLTGDRICSGTGIQVDADDVTIDLCGFALKGPDSGTNYGIYMDGRNNVEIHNGTVRGFIYGIYEYNNAGQGHRVIDVRALYNVLGGIFINGSDHLIKNCRANDNGASATDTVRGIYVGSGSTMTGNTVCDNGTSATGTVYSIYTGIGSTMTGNTVFKNGFKAAKDVYGAFALDGCTVTDNTVCNNGFMATGIGKKVYGIFAGDGCTVTGNSVFKNGYMATNSDVYGISLGEYSLVEQNTAYLNGVAAASVTEITYGVAGCVYGINVPPAP